ncbi:hypothetical protein AMECASPLE_032988, partial [Ameca splendens]
LLPTRSRFMETGQHRFRDLISCTGDMKGNPCSGRWAAGAYLQWSMGGRRGTPWTGRQSIARQHRVTQDKQPCIHPFIPKGYLERAMNLPVMALDCGRKPEYPKRIHTCTGENMQTPYRKAQSQEMNPKPSCRKVTMLPTAPQCSLFSQLVIDITLNFKLQSSSIAKDFHLD